MKQDYYIKNTFSKFIEISGNDRANFLQSLITNDINKCNNNHPIYSCFLSPQGKFLADFFIVNLKTHYLIEIHEKFFESFYSKLRMYKLRSQVNITENNELLSLIIFSQNIIPLTEKLISFKDPRHNNLGIKVYLNQVNELEISKIYIEYDFHIYRKFLIINLIPDSVNDLIENKSLLLENNFQNINAIDWNKGCYIGQEITARMKYRALLKKKIYVLELLTGSINIGEMIKENDINFGNVISIVDKYILCMLKISLVESRCTNKEEIKMSQTTQLKFL